MNAIEKKFAIDELTDILNNLKRESPLWLRRYLINPGQRSKIGIAIISFNEAINETRKYIKRKNNKTEDEIKDLWEKAFKDIVDADIGRKIPPHILNKVRYWGNREEWDSKKNVKEVIPSLDSLERSLKEIEKLVE